MTGEFDLYHPSGVRVRMAVETSDSVALLGHIFAALKDGWLKEPPGLEAGEESIDVDAVVRREKHNSDGTDTPIIDLYHGDLEFKSLTVYLNNEADVAAFEAASGLSLSAIPLYIAQQPMQRGQNPRLERQFVAQAPRPFVCICAPNPKYDEKAKAEAEARKEVYKVSKRRFVRWEGANQAPAAAPPQTAPDFKTVGAWKAWLDTDPPLDRFNAHLGDLAMLSAQDKRAVWDMLKAHANNCGWSFNEARRVFDWASQNSPF